MEKKLKIVLIVLVMILICLIGFGGVYIKKLVSYNNILPEYELGSNLSGSRITTLSVDTETTTEVIYDSEGNVVDEIPEDEDESTYTTEEVLVNSEDSFTNENYEKAKEVMIDRLNALGVSNYEVRLDKENGNISIEITEGDNTDTVLTDLITAGKFEMVDTEDGTVLLTNDDIKSANVLYNSSTSGVVVYLDIKFTKDGKKKLEQISKDYMAVEETEDENEESEEETEQKTITIYVDDEEFLSTYFSEEITTGELTVSIGSATTDSDTLNEYLTEAQYYATIIGNGELPLVYTVVSSDYVYSVYSNTLYQYVLLGVLVILILVSIVYMIFRYKKLGLLSSIVYIATVALVLVLVRYVGVAITLETILAAILLILINTYANCTVLKSLNKDENEKERKDNLKKVYLKIFNVLIVTLILSIVFTYNSFLSITSIGTFLFWGVITILLMNGLFTRKLLLLEVKN